MQADGGDGDDDGDGAAHAPPAPKRARSSCAPWELAASYAALVGEILVGEAATRATSEPLPAELIATLVRGSELYNDDGGGGSAESLVGLVHLLEYGESAGEVLAAPCVLPDGLRVADGGTADGPLTAADTPLSRVFYWAAELCARPEMVLSGVRDGGSDA